MFLSNKPWNRDSIFFDGYLPLHKRDIRKERLEKSRRELLKFKGNHLEGMPILPGASENAGFFIKAPKLFSGVSSQPRHLGIPAPPFLVPSIIETVAGR